MPVTVLVVDDDHDIRESLADVLRDDGFDVLLAADGREALELIENEEPDVILLDLRMPVMSGWELMRAMQEVGKKVPTIVMSAVPAAGVATYLEKPIALERLLGMLDAIRATSTGRVATTRAQVGNVDGAIAKEPRAPQHRSMGSGGGGKGSVLIVDDDEDTRTCVAGILEAEGYEVRTAANGKGALDALATGAPPDLMLLDLMMPVMTGWDVLESIRNTPRLASLSVVVFSAADGSTSPQKLTRPMLRKPIDLDLLLEMVDRLCATSALGDDPPSDLLPKQA